MGGVIYTVRAEWQTLVSSRRIRSRAKISSISISTMMQHADIAEDCRDIINAGSSGTHGMEDSPQGSRESREGTYETVINLCNEGRQILH